MGATAFPVPRVSLPRAHGKVRDAVPYHFDEGKVPKIIRLRFVREEVTNA